MNNSSNTNQNIIITGVGGQGNVTLARLIGESVINDNKYITIGETFGASQRGGSVMSHLRIGNSKIYSPVIPLKKADLIIGLEPVETLRVLISYGNPEIITVSNKKPIIPANVLSGEAEYPLIENLEEKINYLSKKTIIENFTEIGIKDGHHLLSNSIISGVVSGLKIISGFNEKNFTATISKYYFGKTLEKNIAAFLKGFKMAEIY
ncbi:MAG: 2-oxoacid:acceptor oxidoreductase family protein [Desulfobacteraceae bacterium]|nr:2-oxoacid:acceptor oxidoreductase family protein [Desulfobacteraceae bacterium]MCB9494625.1 2-oxoacid:acceptor oxidoreductase family protein [Desulfobacteraceae bacterium]